MIASPSYTNARSFIIDEFKQLRTRARRASLFANILRRGTGLKSLAYTLSLDLRNKRYLGIQNIAIDSIIGTMGRNTDFDQDFRPLHEHLRDRWVNAYLLHDSDGWAPIVVHKLGDMYYVEDGHHRVSVAKTVGMLFIEAEVWDHSTSPVRPCTCRPMQLTAKKPVCACAAD